MTVYNSNSITEGVIWKQLLKFFFPILLGTFFQQLYNTADAIIVGHFLGPQALVAVGGGTATAINLLIGFFVGLSSGASVIISQYYGAKDNTNIEKSIHNAFALAIVGGFIISVLGYISSEALLKVLNTPEDAFTQALSYMRIYFAGSIIVVIYNIGSGIFRAIGDSKSPLYFLIIGCLVNIILDILFISILKMDVEGAAIATLISQFVSLFLVVWKLTKRNDSCKLYFRKIKFDKIILNKTIRIGIPAGIQSVMYSISNLFIHSYINKFGTITSAAWSAYGKLDSLFWMIINAYGLSITTFVGQNYGAGKINRAKKGVTTCLGLSLVTTLILELVFVFFGKYGLALFTTDLDVIQVGQEVINTIAPTFFTYICVEILSGAIRGTGKAFIPTLFSVFGICGVRILWLLLLPEMQFMSYNLKNLILCYPITWIITSLLFVFYYKFGHIYGTDSSIRIS